MNLRLSLLTASVSFLAACSSLPNDVATRPSRPQEPALSHPSVAAPSPATPAQVLNESLQIHGAAVLYEVQSGKRLVELKQLFPGYLLRIPSGWSLVGDELVWRGVPQDAAAFCAAFDKRKPSYVCEPGGARVTLRYLQPRY